MTPPILALDGSDISFAHCAEPAGIVVTPPGNLRWIGGAPIELGRPNRPGLRLCARYDAGVTETASASTKEIWTMSPTCS
jgi:hypothetical protein